MQEYQGYARTHKGKRHRPGWQRVHTFVFLKGQANSYAKFILTDTTQSAAKSQAGTKMNINDTRTPRKGIICF